MFHLLKSHNHWLYCECSCYNYVVVVVFCACDTIQWSRFGNHSHFKTIANSFDALVVSSEEDTEDGKKHSAQLYYTSNQMQS